MPPVRQRPLVFISYSRDDAEWRRRFTEMLNPLVRERRLEVWSDDRAITGYEWRPQLAEAIERARAALLLVSPAFLASDFIMDTELPALVRHGVRLVPVLLRPSLWHDVPLLEGLQWAHDPRRDGPVALSVNPEGQIVEICRNLRDLLADEEVSAEADDGSVLRPPQASWTGPVASSPWPGELHGVPPLPPGWVAREELTSLREVVLGAGCGVAGVTGRALGLSGQGGIGKTVMAAALAHDETVRRCFSDGVFWVTIGERGNLVAAQIGLLERLGAKHPGLRSASQGRVLLEQELADRRCLVIVDDVWSVAAAAAFRAAGRQGRVVYTTRDPAVLAGVGADETRIGALPAEAAYDLLRHLTGVQVLPSEADRICAATGCVALAVALIGAAIGRGGRTWEQAAAQLDGGAGTFLDHPYANNFKAMQVGVSALAEPDAEAYHSLAVYPGDTVVPVTAIVRLWAHLFGSSVQDTRAQLAMLAAHHLLSATGDGIEFHDQEREFLLLYTDDLSVRHADLLAAYLPPDGSWARLPRDELYIWDHLVYHLRGAGDGAALAALCCDLGWLAMRCFLSGPYAAETDLRQVAALYPDHGAIAWLVRLLTQWGHLFSQQPTVGDLAATLASRARDAPAPVDSATLADLLPQRYLAPLWDPPTAPPALVRVLEGHVGQVYAVAFSPDGRLLASGGRDGMVRVHDLATGQAVAVLAGHTGGVRGVAFSPDGRRLASGGLDGMVRVWNLATGQAVAVLAGHTGGVRGVAFSPDGQQLASGSWDGWVRLWDPATGRLVRVLDGNAGGAYVVAFAPDGRLLASGGWDRTVRLWDPATGQPVRVLEGHTGGVRGVAFSADGRLLASATDNGMVRWWDPVTGRLVSSTAGPSAGVNGVAFSPDGLLAGGADDGQVLLWDPATGHLAAALPGYADGVYAVACSPDDLLASAGDDGTVRVWRSVAGQHIAVPDGDADWVYAVAPSPDGRLLVSVGEDGMLRVWDAVTGERRDVVVGHVGGARGVAFSRDGLRLASVGEDALVRVWDPVTGQSVAVLTGHVGRVSGVAFSPDGRRLASAGDDGTVRVWDLATGQHTVLPGHAEGAYGVAFSPDGQVVASAGEDGVVRLWDPETGRISGELAGHVGWVSGVAFSPDGRVVASVGEDGVVRLWDPETGRLSGELAGHVSEVYGVAFSPDGRLLASADFDGTVRLWDASNPAAISQLKVGVPVTALAWGPHGITVAARASPLQLVIRNSAIDA